MNNPSTFVFQAENSRAGPPETPASTAAARRSIFAPKARDDLVILTYLAVVLKLESCQVGALDDQNNLYG